MRQYIPFRVVELEPNSYHILVNANINNTPVVLIVDSGASRTVIDKIYGAHISRTGLYLALEPWANGKSAGTACATLMVRLPPKVNLNYVYYRF